MLNKIKNLFVKNKKPKKVQATTPNTESKIPLSDKELATKNGEPYVSIVKIDVDPNNINSGSFELDWNDKFLLNLIRAGYKIREDDTDHVIVDRWFTQVCKNVALEIYEQEQADPFMRQIKKRDLGDGRSEIS